MTALWSTVSAAVAVGVAAALVAWAVLAVVVCGRVIVGGAPAEAEDEEWLS